MFDRALKAIALCVACLAPAMGMAERSTLGWGRLFTNDQIGDGEDRWRTGSYMLSLVRGPGWDGRAPTQPGAVLEYRLRSEIIAPERLNGTRRDDRPYAGIMSMGVHSYWSRGDWDLNAGGDIVMVGPATGLGTFQKAVHRAFDLPSVRVLDRQLDNKIHLSVAAEAARPIPLSRRLTARPFIAMEAGPETLARVGADLFVGRVGPGDLLLRDPGTGQLLRAIPDDDTGIGFVFGADYAHVENSAWLPGPDHAERSDRFRARGGVHWQIAEDMNFFYGATWLSPEFEGQPEGQVLGSVKVNFNF